MNAAFRVEHCSVHEVPNWKPFSTRLVIGHVKTKRGIWIRSKGEPWRFFRSAGVTGD